MCSIYAIGPGGGGGSGGNTSTGDLGGAGGGSGAVSRLTIPIFMLPDSLYIRVSPGGSGGAPVLGALGNNGNVDYVPLTTMVSIAPSTGTSYLYLEANPGGGGGGGTTSSAIPGTGGTASSARPFALLGATLFIAGVNGASGSSSGNGSSTGQLTGSQIYGGASGASYNFGSAANGGGMAALANTPFIATPGVAGPGGNGTSWSTIFPCKVYGGAGGGHLGGSTKFAGGNGHVWGAGGGGGGASYSTVTLSGAGGDGGPGAVIIQCW